MRRGHLTAVDLNLLKVLTEVARRGSVTDAAKALGVGQPAVSQALARLRETLKDDLFVRTATGMKPTPRLEGLIGSIQSSLDQIEQALFGPQDFDAARTQTRFVIGATDYAAALLTPKLMAVMKTRMPQSTLAILPADRFSAMQLLNDGAIDLAVGLFSKPGPWISRRHLFADSHVCVFNPRLLDLPNSLTLEDYAAQDHLLVSLDGSPDGFVDSLLREHGTSRRVAVVTPFFLQCAYVLERLPLVATLPRRFVEGCSTLSKMAYRSLPFETPEFLLSATWRASDDRNPRSTALRDAILAGAKEL
jgi:DNA-binding transcriptional LysR family regulator